MERFAWPENLSSSRKHAIQDLLHDQNPTKKLRDLFDAHSQTGNNTGQPLFAEDLFFNVLRSFGNSISESMSAESDEVLQLPTNACVRSEISEGSESIKPPIPSVFTSMERFAWPQNLSTSRKRMIEEILRAQKSVTTLLDLFSAQSQAGNNIQLPSSAEDLLEDLKESFANSLSLLGMAESDEVSQVPTKSCVRFEDSDEESTSTPVPRQLRGTSNTWTRLDDHEFVYDGYSWRKYAQEAILKSEFPSCVCRNYYGCSHKFDQGCQATKQVQKIKDDPPIYRTICQGHHTCK
ncbi:WRKY DNA-binding transcription factor 70-like isoform X1 [Eucalyptus grandis]|uniref:WRKY DNA-binding transcription factor 70-like isoform X1 n=1 Tax=Eucalyptus grandis TaxID=71139 RepID=UPI00192EBBF9|nr:WRKY DNA-binding transcription factor 70-like isoform X1 [Eucalyptus grandis]